MRRLLLVLGVVALVLALTLVMAVPAFAVVHAVTPSNECSGTTGRGGQGLTGLGHTGGRVSGPVPGSTGVGSDVPDACGGTAAPPG